MQSAFIVRRKHYITIIAPYDPVFVERIKSIPKGMRDFNPENKTWDVFGSYQNDAIAIVKRCYRYGVEYLQESSEDEPITASKKWKKEPDSNDSTGTREGGADRPPSGDDAAYAKLGLLRGANAKLIKAAYRVLSQEVHPDTSGKDGTEFRELTEAYEQLLRKVGG